MYLSRNIGAMEAFELVSDGSDIPVFAWRLKSGHTENWTLYNLSDRLRAKGWLVPAYPMPEDLQDVVVQRIVVRYGLGYNLARDFLVDLEDCVDYLDHLAGPLPAELGHPGFAH